jgi:cell division protein FtsB
MRRSRLTSRAAVLACVLVGLIIALAYPTRQYIAQRSQIADQAAESRQTKHQVAALRKEKARWQDPAYVEAQARERLHFVKPGEVPFLFPKGSAGAPGALDRSSTQQTVRAPWYRNLWDSVDAADRTPGNSANSTSTDTSTDVTHPEETTSTSR